MTDYSGVEVRIGSGVEVDSVGVTSVGETDNEGWVITETAGEN